MKTTDMFKLRDWMVSRRTELTKHNRAGVARLFTADTGIVCGTSTIGMIEKDLGITRSRGNASNPSARKERIRVVAQELRRVMESLGVTPSADLTDICDCR